MNWQLFGMKWSWPDFMVLSQNFHQGTVDMGRMWKMRLWPILWYYPTTFLKELAKRESCGGSRDLIKILSQNSYRGLLENHHENFGEVSQCPGMGFEPVTSQIQMTSVTDWANLLHILFPEQKYFLFLHSIQISEDTVSGNERPDSVSQGMTWVFRRFRPIPWFNDPSCPPRNSIGWITFCCLPSCIFYLPALFRFQMVACFWLHSPAYGVEIYGNSATFFQPSWDLICHT